MIGSSDSLGRSGVWVFYIGDKVYKMESYSKGKLEGIANYFYKNGKLRMELMYKNNRINGEFKYYSSKGELLAKYEFINDKKYKVIYYVIDSESPPKTHDYFPPTTHTW